MMAPSSMFRDFCHSLHNIDYFLVGCHCSIRNLLPDSCLWLLLTYSKTLRIASVYPSVVSSNPFWKDRRMWSYIVDPVAKLSIEAKYILATGNYSKFGYISYADLSQAISAVTIRRKSQTFLVLFDYSCSICIQNFQRYTETQRPYICTG